MQAARDKDGVFMPKELYDKQIKDKEWSDKEIQEKTGLLKAMEEELEKLKVRKFFLILPLFQNWHNQVVQAPR